MAGRDTLGEVVLVISRVVTGATTEVTDITALVWVWITALVVLDHTSTSPSSPFPPSTSVLAKEEDLPAPTGAEEEEE